MKLFDNFLLDNEPNFVVYIKISPSFSGESINGIVLY